MGLLVDQGDLVSRAIIFRWIRVSYGSKAQSGL